MTITVLGAGAIGSAVAHDLCHRAEVARVQVCEARPNVLRAFRNRLDHAGLRTFESDARDARALEPLLRGSACVISCMAAEHSPQLAALALDAGAHFIDLGGPDAIVQDTLLLAPKAEERQRWIVPNSGLAPGLVNLLAMRGLKRFEHARAVRVFVGDLPVAPERPFSFRLAHSAEKLIEDYTEPVALLRDGHLEHCPPLTGLERVTVDGFGELEAFYAAGGLPALARALEGRLERLDVKTLRYPGHAAQMRFLFDLGFADTQVLDVRTHLTYRDVLIRRMRQRLGGAYEDAVLIRVEIEGTADETEQTLIYEVVDRFDHDTGLSAMQRCTAFPATAVAMLLAGRHVPGGGAAPPEQVIPFEPFFADLAARGIVVEERWAEAEALAA